MIERVNEYFFGDTPTLADALWFYGFIVFSVLISTLAVLY